MEYADEGDLLQKIKARRQSKKLFSELFVKKVLISLVEGLYSLHYKSILYRDMKVNKVLQIFIYLFYT